MPPEKLKTWVWSYLPFATGITKSNRIGPIGEAQIRLAPTEARYRTLLASSETKNRPAELAAALSADGYAASIEEVGTGVQVCQHHCPVAHVAADFPQLCEAETEAFGRLLGTHVQRLATIAHGDGVCTTHVPIRTSTDTLKG